MIGFGLRMLTPRDIVDERDGLYGPSAEELPVRVHCANAIAQLCAAAPEPQRIAA